MFKSNNIIKRLTLLFMSIILILTTIPLQSSYVYAYNGEQGGGDEGAGSLGNGVSASRTGFLFYITDEDGYAQTRSIAISPNSIPWGSMDDDKKLYATKIGNVSSSISYPIILPSESTAPTPVIWSGSAFKANGLAVKAWLLTPGSSSGLLRYEYLIKQHLGEDVLNKVRAHAGEWYVWVEPFAWTKLWKNGSCTGDMWFATASNWAQIYGDYSLPYGDKQINGFTHKALPYSMVLEYPMSFPKHGKNYGAHGGEPMRVLDNEKIQNDGYGLHIIPTESNGIHTYNGVDSPGNPETNDPPRDGTCNIVKGYYTEERENGVVTGYINDGTYSTLMCTNIVGLPFQAGSPYFIQR